MFAGSSALRRQRVEADLAPILVEIAHGRRHHHTAFRIGKALGDTAAHGSDQRVGRAEVDADGDAALVRIGRLAGF